MGQEQTNVATALQGRFTRGNDDKVKEEFQELGLEMQKWYPENQWGWMWSLLNPKDGCGLFSTHEVRLAHEKTVAQNKRSVAYLNTILRAPYKDETVSS